MQRRLQAARPRPSRPPNRTLPILLLIAMPLVFWWGRKSVEQPPNPPIAPVAPVECPPVPSTRTSTAGLCPCPRPKKPRTAQVLPLEKRQTPPQQMPAFERDPTETTGRYLKEHASDLSQCAPNTGARLRVHLEVHVSPSGAVEKVRITNLEPVTAEIAACVDRTVRALKPPGFDGTAPEIFALTVVL